MEHTDSEPGMALPAPLDVKRTRPGFLGLPSKFETDEATGFMVSPRSDGITVQLKLNILEMYRSSGNLTESCRINGVEPRLIRYHCKHDPVFKEAIDECREALCDKAEGHIVQWMGEQKNVIDRLAWLRAYRPDRWNPKQETTMRHSVEVTHRLAEKARQVIDTTAVNSNDKGS
jgi:hypothetical protein